MPTPELIAEAEILKEQLQDVVKAEEKSRLRCIQLEKEMADVASKQKANDAAVALFMAVRDVMQVVIDSNVQSETKTAPRLQSVPAGLAIVAEV